MRTRENTASYEMIITPPQLIAVTDLGPNNLGKINCAELSSEQRQSEIDRVCAAEAHRKPTNRFRCVDGRRPAEGINAPEGYTDPQIAGGVAITETAADMMVETRQHLSKGGLIALNTREAISDGLEVVVHGDTHNGKAGCGANVLIQPTLAYNADNAEVIVPTAWYLGEQLGLDKLLREQDISWLIDNGRRNANIDSLWDVTPDETVDIALNNGAQYEELVKDHNEKAIVVETSGSATDAPDAFVASLGAYKEKLFERKQEKGKDERETALRMMAVILFNVGVPKQLTAEEKGHGEALPVVILGKKN